MLLVGNWLQIGKTIEICETDEKSQNMAKSNLHNNWNAHLNRAYRD